MKKVIEYLIYIYIILIMFGGIITKFTFNTFIFKYKVILPDLLILVLMLFSLIYIIVLAKNQQVKFKLSIDSIFVIYIYIIFLISIPNINDIKDVLLVSRDVVFPFFVYTFLKHIVFGEEELKNFNKKLIFIFSMQIVMGFVLAAIQNRLDWEWTSKFYTGYSFYGVDEVSNIKIWHTNGILRVPSLAGNSVLFAYYNYISYLNLKYSSFKFRKVLLIISIINIVLSTNKTVIFMIMLEFIFSLLKKLNPLLRTLVLEISMVILSIVVSIIFLHDKSVFNSLFERFKLWYEILNEVSNLSFIFPNNLFNIGSGTEGVLVSIDNSYIYILLSYGILGLILFTIFIYKLTVKNIKMKHNINFGYMLGIIICGLTTNLFQGRVYITLILIFLSINNMKNQDIRKKYSL